MPVAPKVSVIVPVFNAGEKLVTSIGSLLNQTLKDIEIIIVNDASTDKSGLVIDQLAKENANIVPVHFLENKGVHEARLAGLKKSTAPWIGFLDADDFARPNMYSSMLAAALNHDVDIVVCGSDRVTERREIISKKIHFLRSEKVSENVFDRFCAFDFGTGMLWNKLFRRTVIEPWFHLHFPWRQNINEDLLLNIGCFYNATSIFLLRDVLHEYVFVDTSVTTRMENSWAYVEIFRAYTLAVIHYQKLGPHVLSKIIDMYRNQIGWRSYQLVNAVELSDHLHRLEEALHLLCKENLFALSAIVARPETHHVDPGLAVRSLLHLMKNKFKNLLLLFGN